MAMASTLQDSLRQHHLQYEVTSHSRTGCSMDTAMVAHIPGDRLAKSVILGDEYGYVMAVVPANRHVAVHTLSRNLGRHLHLADEDELVGLFPDCVPGAIPPIGSAYGLRTVVDEALARQSEVFFEAGDHEGLVHMAIDDFLDLMAEADRAPCSLPM